jgi:hypothetical protein
MISVRNEERYANNNMACMYFTLLRQENHNLNKSCGSAVGKATDYVLDDRGVEVGVPVESIIFTFPCRRNRPRVPPSLLPSAYRW